MAKRKIARAGIYVAALALVVTMTVAGTASARFGEKAGKGQIRPGQIHRPDDPGSGRRL
jgi:hypothetical protein